jgi:hypothetical protein
MTGGTPAGNPAGMEGGAQGGTMVIGDVCTSRVPDEYTPCPVSIYEAKDLNSTNEGRLVQVEGILMAKRFDDGNPFDREWAIQVSPRDASYRNAENSGIWVDLTQALVVVEANIGDVVRVQGEVDQSSGYRIIARAKTTEKIEAQLASPTPMMVNAMDIMTNGNAVRQYEGMLVTVAPVQVDANQFPAVAGDSDPNGEFSINGGLRVDNALYQYQPMPQVGQSWEKMTGILKFNLGDAKLLPRSPEDYGYLGNPMNLVVNEINYNQSGSDTLEYVEIYNPGPEPAPLAGVKMELINGSTMMQYKRVDLSDAGAVLPPQSFLVVGKPALLMTLPMGVMSLTLSTSATTSIIQNDAEAVRLIHDSLGVIDLVGYGGFVGEGMVPSTAVDSDNGDFAVGRCYGLDTDNNAMDIHELTPSTPGTDNLPCLNP